MSETASAPPLAIDAKSVAPRAKASNYPEPFLSRMSRREKRALGDVFGLNNFGVNLTRLLPMHRHSKQDESIFVLEGAPTLITESGEVALHPGMCAGFPARGAAHRLVNRSSADVVYLEIGDRSAGDAATYPNDDIAAQMDAEGKWIFTHKDGRPLLICLCKFMPGLSDFGDSLTIPACASGFA